MRPDFADQISVSSMSNLELLLVKDNKEEVEFDLLKKPITEFEAACHSNASSQDLDSRQQNQEERSKAGNIEKQEEEEERMRKTADSSVESRKPPSLGELKATGDDEGEEDGFRTPTSVDHKIPAITECPPAPRRPRPLPSLKRKASSTNNARRSLLLDLSQEVESLFPMSILSGLHQNIKKARTDNDEPTN